MDAKERFLTALARREPDRVPLFELGANPKPALRVILPPPLRQLVARPSVYANLVGCVRELYGMEPKKRSL